VKTGSSAWDYGITICTRILTVGVINTTEGLIDHLYQRVALMSGGFVPTCGVEDISRSDEDLSIDTEEWEPPI